MKLWLCRGSSVVERKPEELSVVGSIPTLGTMFCDFFSFFKNFSIKLHGSVWIKKIKIVYQSMVFFIDFFTINCVVRYFNIVNVYMKKIILFLLPLLLLQTYVSAISSVSLRQWTEKHKLLALLSGGLAVGGISWLMWHLLKTRGKASQIIQIKEQEVKQGVFDKSQFVTYKSVLEGFQLLKYFYSDHQNKDVILNEIMNAKDGGKIVKIIRKDENKIQNSREFEDNKLLIKTILTYKKFKANFKFQNELIAYKKKLFFYINNYDERYWGIYKNQGQSENMYGKILQLICLYFAEYSTMIFENFLQQQVQNSPDRTLKSALEKLNQNIEKSYENIIKIDAGYKKSLFSELYTFELIDLGIKYSEFSKYINDIKIKINSSLQQNITIEKSTKFQENVSLKTYIELLEKECDNNMNTILASLYNAMVDTINQDTALMNYLLLFYPFKLFYFNQDIQNNVFFTERKNDSPVTGGNFYSKLIEICINRLISGKALKTINLFDSNFFNQIKAWIEKIYEKKIESTDLLAHKFILKDSLLPEKIFTKAIEIAKERMVINNFLDKVDERMYFFCNNSEVLYQLCRFYDFKNKKAYEDQELIFFKLMQKIKNGEQTPDTIQRLARGYGYGDKSDFNKYNLLYMSYIVWLKFATNYQLRDLLLKTENKKIQEIAKNDEFWGVGKTGSGKNNLGKLLQYIRYCFASGVDFISEIRGRDNDYLEDLYNKHNNSVKTDNLVNFYEGTEGMYSTYETKQYSNFYQEHNLILIHDKFLEDIADLRSPLPQ